jgi:SAM-dependent methyltransferase
VTTNRYVGNELDLFAAAQNWKAYWSETLLPYIHGDVLEVGAGIGSNTPHLDKKRNGRWVCLEPDPELCSRIVEGLGARGGGADYEVVTGTISAIKSGQAFDTILYIDVLEHIERDRDELREAAKRLRPGGRVIVLSPAHDSLYTPFDKAIGHFRRYDRRMLTKLSPDGLEIERILYMDSAGLLLSAANRVLLRQSMPTPGQIRLWDRRVVPISRLLDRIVCHSAGKTIVGIWTRVIE